MELYLHSPICLHGVVLSSAQGTYTRINIYNVMSISINKMLIAFLKYYIHFHKGNKCKLIHILILFLS